MIKTILAAAQILIVGGGMLFGAYSALDAQALSSATPASCATIPVATATREQAAQLYTDARCFERLETAAAARSTLASRERASAKASKDLRLKRVAVLMKQPEPPPPPVFVPTPSVGPIASIASNFDVAAELVPSWGSGAIPSSGAPDVVGAFRFICNPSHEAADDPVVYPNQPGRSHLHQFFGNTKANASSTYASLRSAGMSTCNSPLNRSSYWMPAMMNGKGRVVRPDYISIYYKRRPASDPQCKIQGDECVALPRGLRFVFGHDMLDTGGAKTGSGYFDCNGAGAVSGHFATIVEAAKGCPAGARLGAVISAPECWDGVNLDSPDHRSHVAYPGYGNTGVLRCPSTHPKVIPTFTQGAWYTVDDDLDRTGSWTPAKPTWHLSSDVMPGMAMMTPGSSFHADWFGAWDDEVMAMWTAGCIDKLLNCSGGDLGNGKQLRMFDGFKWNAEPRVVDVPKL